MLITKSYSTSITASAARKMKLHTRFVSWVRPFATTRAGFPKSTVRCLR